jgi:hypothetical protein
MVKNFATIIGHGVLEVCLVSDEKMGCHHLLYSVKTKLIFSCYEFSIVLGKFPNIDVNLPFSSCTKVVFFNGSCSVTYKNIKVAS